MREFSYIRLVSVLLFLPLVLSFVGCIERKPESQARRESPVSTELSEMVAKESRLTEATAADSIRLDSTFQNHRKRVLELLAGALIEEKNDLYGAALILHGSSEPTVCLLAYHLALQSARKGHSRGRYLAATALDRSLVLNGQRQRFGTQSFVSEGGKLKLYPVDSLISDSERAAWDVPPLESLGLVRE